MSWFSSDDPEFTGAFLFLIFVLSLGAVILLVQRADGIHEKMKVDALQKQRPVEQDIALRSDEWPRQGELFLPDGKSAGSDAFYQSQIIEAEFTYGSGVIDIFHEHRFLTLFGYGTDDFYHPLNAFLLGFAPFKDEREWVPLAAIGLRIQYLDDRANFYNSEDSWQTSKQVYRHGMGDCDDHAILLADWLQTMGHDARVVVGKYRGTWHAWVVLFKEGEAYILEATAKQFYKKYPLARMMPDYQPHYMFDLDTFWINEKTPLTTDYFSDGWRKASRFSAVA